MLIYLILSLAVKQINKEHEKLDSCHFLSFAKHPSFGKDVGLLVLPYGLSLGFMD